jgi:hypothetical protein
MTKINNNNKNKKNSRLFIHLDNICFSYDWNSGL